MLQESLENTNAILYTYYNEFGVIEYEKITLENLNQNWKQLNDINFYKKYKLSKKKCKRVELSYPRDNTRKPRRYKDPFYADVIVRERM